MTISQMQVAPAFSGPLTRGFLLIEPTTLVHVPELAALDMQPCTPRVLAHREELMPQLVNIAALEDEARALATEYWMAEAHVERPPVICAWMDSDADADAIIEHIARHLVGPGVDGKPAFWRYYDPRVLTLTLAILDSAQRKALLGPIREWQFAWAGQRWGITNAREEAADDDRPSGWPRPEQWTRINHSEVADRILRRLPALSNEQAARLPATLDQLFSESALTSDTKDVDVLVEFMSQRVRDDLKIDAKKQGSKQ
jgi:hypothetical protein